MLKKDIIEQFDENSLIRLNKYLSDAGVCSRRQADRAIEEGKVIVDGKKATMGMKILPSQEVYFDGKSVKREEEMIFIALNKPVGVECTADRDTPDNVIDFVGMKKRIYPVGRLDKNSEGLLLLTNNGAIVNKIMKASNNHEKEYIVKVNKDITNEFIDRMRSGVHIKDVRSGEIILDAVTRKCKVTKVNKNTFNIVLTQGLNRQIRRMCKELGYGVISLKRIRIMNIELGNLEIGKYRDVTKKELEELKGLLK